MNQALMHSELTPDIKPFMDFLLTLRRDKPIPILRDFAVLVTDINAEDKKPDFLRKKIDRVYLRLCRAQEELSSLDFKKAKSDATPEDFIFSRIDFSRYREISEEDFVSLFLEGLADFPDSFYRKNFNLDKDEINSLINECYEKKHEVYKLKKENPTILSIMRTLEVSLEASPIFTIDEIQNELNFLKGIVGATAKMPDAEKLFSLLIMSLENVSIMHKDSMVTELLISPQSGLSGIFHPGGKAWTRVLVPAG